MAARCCAPSGPPSRPTSTPMPSRSAAARNQDHPRRPAGRDRPHTRRNRLARRHRRAEAGNRDRTALDQLTPLSRATPREPWPTGTPMVLTPPPTMRTGWPPRHSWPASAFGRPAATAPTCASRTRSLPSSPLCCHARSGTQGLPLRPRIPPAQDPRRPRLPGQPGPIRRQHPTRQRDHDRLRHPAHREDRRRPAGTRHRPALRPDRLGRTRTPSTATPPRWPPPSAPQSPPAPERHAGAPAFTPENAHAELPAPDLT